MLFDLIVFSPPYPNNIDYTEVYKLENWLLGLITTSNQFREQRLRTIRSHPSVQFPDRYPIFSNGHSREMTALVDPLLECVPKDRSFNARTRLIRGYFDDMAQILVASRKRLKSKGHLAYVVGNSLHGSLGTELPIAADLLIARMAEFLGYEVVTFMIARQPVRRTSHQYGRESLVVLRKD